MTKRRFDRLEDDWSTLICSFRTTNHSISKRPSNVSVIHIQWDEIERKRSDCIRLSLVKSSRSRHSSVSQTLSTFQEWRRETSVQQDIECLFLSLGRFSKISTIWWRFSTSSSIFVKNKRSTSKHLSKSSLTSPPMPRSLPPPSCPSCADQTHSTMSTGNTLWIDSTFEQITDLCDGLRWTETSPVRLSPSNSMHQWSLWNLGEGEWRCSPLLFSRNEGEGVSVISVLPCRQWIVLFD